MRLRNLITGPSSDLGEFWIADFVTDTGDWNLENLNQILPEELVMKIVVVLPPDNANGADKLSALGQNYKWSFFSCKCVPKLGLNPNSGAGQVLETIMAAECA